MMKQKYIRAFSGAVCLGAALLAGCGQPEGAPRSVAREAVHSDGQFTEETVKAGPGAEEKSAAETAETAESEDPQPDLNDYDFTISFTGDINLAENWNTMEYFHQQGDDLTKCIDPALLAKMNEADLLCVNMEFALSSMGSPMEGKAYTFRAEPSRTELLRQMGVDVVNLANNHVYDYGKDAFVDMLNILQEEQIPYVGAGMDDVEAQQPYYVELDGKTVAIVSATRAEKYIMTPEAAKDQPGVFRCYDTERLLEVTKEAKEQADFVIAYIHWGTEYSETLEEAQTSGARELAQAGADVVLGAHPHCLQGIEFIGDVPVLYSLGNYWFNEKTLDTVLAELHFYGNDEEQHLDTILIPAVQKNHYTSLLTEKEEIASWNAHMINMSPAAIQIDEQGIVTSAE